MVFELLESICDATQQIRLCRISLTKAAFQIIEMKGKKGGTMADEPQGCARITGSVVQDRKGDVQSSKIAEIRKEMPMNILVGQKAPDFSAPAYYTGKFKTVKLSDYAGKWVLLCFYPGDFTFV
jgi:hypothetical protein